MTDIIIPIVILGIVVLAIVCVLEYIVQKEVHEE